MQDDALTRLKTEELRALVWADLRPMYHHVCRIADQGPDGSKNDMQLVLKVFNLIRAELILREQDLSEG